MSAPATVDPKLVHLKEQYEREGYLSPVQVVDPEEIPRYRACAEAFLAAHGDCPGRVANHKPHLRLKWASELAHSPKLLDTMQALLGPDVLIWRSNFFIKRGHTVNEIPWHQDLTYFKIEPADEVLTAWIALTPSVVSNGCLRVVPGSHKTAGLRSHLLTSKKSNDLLRGQEIYVDEENERVEILELQPGEASIHHSLTVHTSLPNTSGELRMGLAIRFISGNVARKARGRQSATLVRGTDRFGHFDLEPLPRYDYDPVSLGFQRRSAMQFGMEVIGETLSNPTPRRLLSLGRVLTQKKTIKSLAREVQTLHDERRPVLPPPVERLTDVTETPLAAHKDARGAFTEIFRETWGPGTLPQWNLIESKAGSLRGLKVHPVHHDWFVVISGRVTVGLSDLRPGSPTEGRASVHVLSGDDRRALYVPAGIAHSLYFDTDGVVLAGVSEYYDEDDEIPLRWDDPELGIPWSATPLYPPPRAGISVNEAKRLVARWRAPS